MLKLFRGLCLSLIFPSIFGMALETDKLNKTTWHVPIGVGVLMIKEDCVLMLKRTYKDWGFGVIAGELSKGETIRQAAARHVEKEVGVIVNKEDLDFLCSVHYKTENEKEAPLVFFFTTKNWTGNLFNKEPEKHNEIGWFKLCQLPSHLAPGEHLVLDLYKSSGLNQNAYLECGWDDFSVLKTKP